MLKQRDLKVSDRTIKRFLEDIDQVAPWFGVSGDVNLPCWEKLGQDLTEAKRKGELRPGTLPLWRMIRYCLKDGKCIDILREGCQALSAHQDNMSESDSKEKGNLKKERPKSSKASSKLHTKVEKEKETDQSKTKQKSSGLYPVLDEFADLTLSDSAEDELDSEEEEDLEEAAAAYEREREYPQVRIIHYMDDILLAAPSQVMLDKAYAHTVQALEKKGLYIAPEKIIIIPKIICCCLLLIILLFFQKVTTIEPLKGAIEIYTDGSKSGVGAYMLQGQDPVQFRFQPNTPQIVECQIVYEVFKRFHEPFNLLSDSHYVVNAVRGLETSAFIKESSLVHDILRDICVLIRDRTAPLFIGHIRAHTLLPDPMTAANDLADKTTRAFAAVELDSISMAKQFHRLYQVPAHTLCLKFKIS
ncbi:hypothetical protein STEG23_017834 [Scotinomys teguina]